MLHAMPHTSLYPARYQCDKHHLTTRAAITGPVHDPGPYASVPTHSTRVRHQPRNTRYDYKAPLVIPTLGACMSEPSRLCSGAQRGTQACAARGAWGFPCLQCIRQIGALAPAIRKAASSHVRREQRGCVNSRLSRAARVHRATASKP